jgi:hypothetical protein
VDKYDNIEKVTGENQMTQSEYETNRDEYTKYLLLCVRLKDWHGVSDAANDLRVLDAKWSVIEEEK